jgi:hypothetical protein
MMEMNKIIMIFIEEKEVNQIKIIEVHLQIKKEEEERRNKIKI